MLDSRKWAAMNFWFSSSMDELDDKSAGAITAVSTQTAKQVVLSARKMAALELVALNLEDVESDLLRILQMQEKWHRRGWPVPYDMQWFCLHRELECNNRRDRLTMRMAAFRE